MPAVSVCIPTYNYARFVGQAIESVLAQTFEDFELIVCDNASTDDTPEVVASYDDPRLRSYRNDENIGLFGNFNRCLELAATPLVKFVCADDWLAPTYLERAVPVMNGDSGVALLTTAGFVVDEDGRTFGLATGEFGDGPVVSGADALGGQADFLNLIGMPSAVLLRRDAVQEAGGFDPQFAPAADVHLWLKLLCRHELGWLPEPLCYLRVHGSKEHGFGPDPSESVFLSWEDVASKPGSPVTPELLERARYAGAQQSILYVVAHVVTGHVSGARRILSLTSRHVRWRSVLPRLLLRLPGLLRQQLARILALRSGRMVIYGRRTRMGGPLRPGPGAS